MLKIATIGTNFIVDAFLSAVAANEGKMCIRDRKVNCAWRA